ncbi:MAG: Maf family nucleotide pyrophosphatase [Bdellovibrionales bacterium]|nr:Maf family nucleotide pyrophosphatase [Bdellovibrionales bacterium]
MKILLASESKYRRQLLDRLRLKYSHAAPLVDEELLKQTALVSPLDLPLYLARKKAESLLKTNLGGITIGCDQMAFLENEPLNKPGTKDKAIRQLTAMQGKTHTLVTAMAVHKDEQWFTHVDTTSLSMRPLSAEEVSSYVDLENPVDCAGSYKVEGLGIALFDSITTQDFTAITGLPLLALRRILTQLGLRIF